MAPHAEIANDTPLWQPTKTKTVDSISPNTQTAPSNIAKTFDDAVKSTYRIIERPIGSRRPLRVVCMGAGYSGLMMAIMFNEKMKNSNATLAVYEKNEDIGGTWLENR